MEFATEQDMAALDAHYADARGDADGRLRVNFELYPVKDEAESDKQGRPIYKEIELITIFVPGDALNIVRRPAWPADKKRFAKQYLAFKAGLDQDAATGTPLAAWPGIPRAEVESLKHLHIRTVEQLADVSDDNTQRYAGLSVMRQRARDFIAAAKGAAPTAELRSELSKRDAAIEAMQRQMKEQADKIEQLTKAATKGR